MNLKNFELNKLHYFILYLFLTFWLFARQGLNINLSFFKYTHYLFNYEYGFIKRGFVGEIMSLFYNRLNYEVVSYLSLILVLIDCPSRNHQH